MAHQLLPAMAILKLQRLIGGKARKMDLDMKISDSTKLGNCSSGFI